MNYFASAGMRILRRVMGRRPVRRQVRGVSIRVPSSHRLPEYVAAYPSYGRNLVDVARALAGVNDPLLIIDIGANVGDSAIEILAHVNARVLCVEGDSYWLRYLRQNLGGEASVTIVPALLLPDERASADLRAVREHGTTRFVTGGRSAKRSLTATELLDNYPEFRSAALVKSDTDGYDPLLVPAIARALQPHSPVLFFEYDPPMAKSVGNAAPEAVWGALREMGYTWAALWDNFGNPLGWRSIETAANEAEVLEGPVSTRGYHYWDVAAVHGDDEGAAGAVRLVVERDRAG